MAAPLTETRSDGIVTLALASPETLNALSSAMLHALAAALDRIAADETIRVVILKAEGKVFSAGHDLKEMQALRRAPDQASGNEPTRRLQRPQIKRHLPGPPTHLGDLH